MPANYLRRTRDDHLLKVYELLVKLTNNDQGKAAHLTERVYLKVGQASAEDSDERARTNRLSKAKELVWSAITKALAALKNPNGGWIDNHRRVARQILLTVLAKGLHVP